MIGLVHARTSSGVLEKVYRSTRFTYQVPVVEVWGIRGHFYRKRGCHTAHIFDVQREREREREGGERERREREREREREFIGNGIP
jgi:hypothetical protein